MVLAHQGITNTHIENCTVLPTPSEIKAFLPLSDRAEKTVLKFRSQLENILDGKDSRHFVVVGPCSIHDVDSAIDYARRLKVLADKVSDKLVLVMRVYFEKPRTTVGWKGLINDPDMDDSFHVEKGLKLARRLLVEIAEMDLPAATEALDPIVPQYISDLITWSAIGARTIESQTHREMASGLSMPVGLKNGTNGNIGVALNALRAARGSHSFLGINAAGQVSVFRTSGNPYGHIILRGGGGETNYEPEKIQTVEEQITAAGLTPRLVIDCSHGNSNKDHTRQGGVFQEIIEQVRIGNKSIVGTMLESHLNPGNQPISPDLCDLEYGVSITDKCMGWDETEALLMDAYHRL
ncbi:MAG: 3-deoxy-7-phosphoheptulonate synthase [Cyanobacteria bacterium P01_D01_bin.73]